MKLVKTKVVKEICDALGLKNVRSLDLHFRVDEIATAEVTFYPDADDLDRATPLFKRYELTEIEP
jgi:hypothetical protein